MSSNLSRIDILAANQRAFEDVFGSPFAKEPSTGHYQTLKGRGAIAAMKNNFDEGKGTRVPAAPNLMDFFCDVENIVSRNLSEGEQERFWETYLYEDSTQFTPRERTAIEQKVGKLLRTRRISPVSRYFKVVRGLTKRGGK